MFLAIIIISLGNLLSSCSGCSRSGLRSEAKKRGLTSSRNDSRSTSRTSKNQTEEKQINYQPNETKEIVPDIVEINNTSSSSLSQMFKVIKPAVFLIITSDGHNYSQGSGFFISPNGIAISNYHVFKGTTIGLEIIKLSNGKEFKISEVLSKNEDKDYIIFRVNINQSVDYIHIAENKSEIGDNVFSIGNPRGLEHSLSTGIVSSYRENDNIIQTTTEIDHGSSGGPLMNLNGEVIGITSSGFEATNLNFAVNIQIVPYNRYIKKKVATKPSKSVNLHNSNFTFKKSLPTTSSGIVINRAYYSYSYVEKYEQSEWVAYKLSVQNFRNNIERTNDYRADPLVVTGTATNDDYKNSGYDRGHLAPAADMKFNYQSMSESFYMSNMSPQSPDFNRDIWRRLEEKIRYWAAANDSIFVVTGPILTNPIDYIGINSIVVPKAYYKVLLGFKNREIKGLAFIMDNKKLFGALYSYIVSIDEVEAITGLDFFPELEKNLQVEVEANEDVKIWFLRNDLANLKNNINVINVDSEFFGRSYLRKIQKKSHK